MPEAHISGLSKLTDFNMEQLTAERPSAVTEHYRMEMWGIRPHSGTISNHKILLQNERF